MGEWVKADDRLPDKNKWVLMYWRPIDHKERPYHREIIIGQFSVYEGGKIWADGRYQDMSVHVTHWMPLPSPPKDN